MDFIFIGQKNLNSLLSASHNLTISRMQKFPNGSILNLRITTFWHQRNKSHNIINT